MWRWGELEARQPHALPAGPPPLLKGNFPHRRQDAAISCNSVVARYMEGDARARLPAASIIPISFSRPKRRYKAINCITFSGLCHFLGPSCLAGVTRVRVVSPYENHISLKSCWECDSSCGSGGGGGGVPQRRACVGGGTPNNLSEAPREIAVYIMSLGNQENI